MMSRQRNAYALVITAILLWSTAGSAFKLTLQYIPAAQLLLFASFVSMVFLSIWKASQNKLIASFRIRRREWLGSAVMGLMNPFAYYIILFEAYDRLLAQEAVALNYIWPVTLVLLSIPVLKQKIGPLSVLALFISFSGLVIIIMKGSFTDIKLSDPLGIFFALASSIFWASYWLMNMKDKREEASKLLVNFVFGFIYVLIYVLIDGTKIMINTEGLIGSAYIGLFEMGLTFVLWLKGLSMSATTAKASNLVYISPFLSLMFVSVAVGETIYWYTVTGLVLIVGGILLQRMVK